MLIHNFNTETSANIQNKETIKLTEQINLSRLSNTTKLEYVPMGITSHTSTKGVIPSKNNQQLKLPLVSHYSSLKPSESKEYHFKLNKIRLLSKLGPSKNNQKIFHNFKRNYLLPEPCAGLSSTLTFIKGNASPIPQTKLSPKIEKVETNEISKQLTPRGTQVNNSKHIRIISHLPRRSKLKIKEVGIVPSHTLNDVGSVACKSVKINPKEILNGGRERNATRYLAVRAKSFSESKLTGRLVNVPYEKKIKIKRPKIQKSSNSITYEAISAWDDLDQEDSLYQH
ncbi:unnamed protein product [Blepharisma stoltei]|uniref:Uncharacterized protein n=1 Tax=Blepharisma stoltei TaxID=1481888 RepID=A0AAU9IS98_9CILI|nr:unnamed protein product [Blepharisma stoltei]